MFVVKLQKNHLFTTFTFQRIIAKSMKNGGTPLIKTAIEAMLFTGDGMMKMFVDLTAASIKAAIADHFKVFFGDMLN